MPFHFSRFSSPSGNPNISIIVNGLYLQLSGVESLVDLIVGTVLCHSNLWEKKREFRLKYTTRLNLVQTIKGQQFKIRTKG